VTPKYFITADENVIYIWDYTNAVSTTSQHFDDNDDVQSLVPQDTEGSMKCLNINCICSSVNKKETNICIGTDNGLIMRYSIENKIWNQKIDIKIVPVRIALSLNGKMFSFINKFDQLMMCNWKNIILKRTDVWDMMWSTDTSDMLAIMEKTRMYIYHGNKVEDPVTNNGYLLTLKDLEATSILFSELVFENDEPKLSVLQKHPTKALKDTTNILKTLSTEKILKFVVDHDHPRLWRLSADHALTQRMFSIAENAYVKIKDYSKILFVKRIQKITDVRLQRAEIEAYQFKKFEEAEKTYMEAGRTDLAIHLNKRIGDWDKVITYLQDTQGNDSELKDAYKQMGDYHKDRQQWNKAFEYYRKANHSDGLIECAIVLEDYDFLESMIDELPENNELLLSLGELFQSVGLCKEATRCYIKCNEIKLAIDACVELNQWDLGVELAEKYNFNKILELISKYTTHLLNSGDVVKAIELYRKAGQHEEVCNLLDQEIIKYEKKYPLLVKKLAIIKGFEILNHRTALISTGIGETSNDIDKLLKDDQHITNKRSIGSWHTAEAYHYYFLSQRLLYQKANPQQAMIVALRCCEYEDILGYKCHVVAALTSLEAQNYYHCSRAFTRLETHPDLNENEKKKYSELATKIFIPNPPPKDDLDDTLCDTCPSCGDMVKLWWSKCASCDMNLKICVSSGSIIVNNHNNSICNSCKHHINKENIIENNIIHCPLCHQIL